jgi:hypothetical protein
MDSNLVPLLEQLSISTSYFLLFLTLQCYGYEIMYRYFVAGIAVLGFCWPPAYYLPYILVLWRVFVGANVITQSKMYIGQRVEGPTESQDPSNASTHWIVAIEQESHYLYTHAVGGVISGQGIKKPFKRIDPAKLKGFYSLTHVGYVTKRNTQQKMVEVINLEPMRSGNSCQEFAVDIAFQLSSSRTYTFMKTMTIWRVRTVVFYAVVSLSVISYVTRLHWAANIINHIVITNLFASIELSRIGVLNTRVQEGYLPVIRAYLNYPKPKNFIQLLLTSLVWLVLYYRIGLVESGLVGFAILIIISINA